MTLNTVPQLRTCVRSEMINCGHKRKPTHPPTYFIDNYLLWKLFAEIQNGQTFYPKKVDNFVFLHSWWPQSDQIGRFLKVLNDKILLQKLPKYLKTFGAF